MSFGGFLSNTNRRGTQALKGAAIGFLEGGTAGAVVGGLRGYAKDPDGSGGSAKAPVVYQTSNSFEHDKQLQQQRMSQRYY